MLREAIGIFERETAYRTCKCSHYPNIALGYQHYKPKDRQKALQVEADGRFKLFLVREDEPYTDPEYLRGRLIDEGFLDP